MNMQRMVAKNGATAPSHRLKIASLSRYTLRTAHFDASKPIFSERSRIHVVMMAQLRNKSEDYLSSINNQDNAPMSLMQRLVATTHRPDNTTMAIMAILGASSIIALLEPSSAAAAVSSSTDSIHVSQPIADLAEDTDFWANVLRYISYFFSVLLGTAYTTFKSIAGLMKNPLTAVLVVVGAAGLYFFVSTTVSAMLGLNDIIEYEPSSIVTPNL